MYLWNDDNPMTQNESTDCTDGDLHILFKNTFAECTCKKNFVRSVQTTAPYVEMEEVEV